MLLQLQSIRKRYGGVTALHDSTLNVAPGEVHLLMGENGAGKSTLMKIVAGMVERDGGRMLWRGQEVFLRSPSDAAAIGISMVHQESLLAPHLTVAENLFLGREPRSPWGWISRDAMTERAKRIIEQHHFPLQAEWRVERLSPAGKQMVEICRAVHRGSSLLIFDEPTSSLSTQETEQVFQIVNALRARGAGVIYITHRLEELRAIGDRVTILRDGATVHTGPLSAITTSQLISHMVGRAVSSIYSRKALDPGKPMLEVENLSTKKVHNISFHIRSGEIVGMAGLIGAGRTELCEALFGIDPMHYGVVHVEGRRVLIHSPVDAVTAGIGLVSEDRQRTGLALRLPISANVTMANVPGISKFGILNLNRQAAVTSEFTHKLRIRCDSPKQLAGRLSGGNQQKVVIAKWLFRQARILIFDEPTRGIDVGAKVEVFEVMNELAKAGAAILMVSSELQELQQVADRILVMRAGRIAGALPEPILAARHHETGCVRKLCIGAARLKRLQKLLPFLSLIFLFIAIWIASPYFLTKTNLSSLVRQTAVINIMALGMTIIIISGGIDLSVGAILAIGGLLGTMAMEKGLPVLLGIAIGIGVGLLCGLLNGILITRLKIAPFIVTLGTLGIFAAPRC